MNPHFASAMRRASQQMRAQNLVEATRLIQEALHSGPRATTTNTDQSAHSRERPPSATGGSGERSADMRGSLSEMLRDRKAGSFNPADLGGFMRGTPAGSADRGSPIPPGARFETRSFTCAAGARSYKLYVPASAPKRPNGLIVMLHGCTQNPDDFAAGTGMNAVAEAHGFLVAYPAQTKSNNASSCWNWFDPANQRRDAGEPAIIAGLTRELIAEFGVDPRRVFVAGLSAGGAMAAVLGETYPELYSAIGVHSGLPTGSAHDMPSAFAAMRTARSHPDNVRRTTVRTIVFHGEADKTVHPSNAAAVLAQATPNAAAICDDVVSGGSADRGYRRTVVSDPEGRTVAELWMIDRAGHAWSGGQPGGSYADPKGPDASAEIMRFFLGEPYQARA